MELIAYRKEAYEERLDKKREVGSCFAEHRQKALQEMGHRERRTN